MRYCARVVISVVCAGFIMSALSTLNRSASTGAAMASRAAPPPAPIDVAKDATPGFTPSIESVVVSGDPFGEDAMRRQVRDWGPKAAPVLIRLYEDPAWEKFRWKLMYMIPYSEAPEVRTWLKRQFQDIQASVSASTPTSEPLDNLCYAMARTYDPELAKLLYSAAQNGKGPVQSACMHAIAEMTNEEAVAVLKEMQPSYVGPLSSQLGDMIANMEGRLRAQRPMSEILEKEGKQ